MVQEIKAGCAQPTGGPVGEEAPEGKERKVKPIVEEVKPMITVGKKAPDFTAPAYLQGDSFPFNFRNISVNGSFFVSTPAISPSSEQPRYRRSPINTRNFRSWE